MEQEFLVDIQTSRHKFNVLVACSKGSVSAPLRHALNTLGFGNIVSRNSYASAAEELRENEYTFVFFDSEPPEESSMSEVEFIEDVTNNVKNIFLIGVSTQPSAENIYRVIRSGARGYLVPPFAPDRIDEVLLHASRGISIDKEILDSPNRNRALAGMVLDSLNLLSKYIKGIEAQVMSGNEPDLEAVLQIDQLSLNVSEGTRAAKKLSEGGPAGFLEALIDESIERARGTTRLGRTRQARRRERERARKK